MYEMNEEQDQLNPAISLPIFHCHLCRNTANHPVLPPCGHLHCWQCLHSLQNCPTCDSSFRQEQLFSIFIDEANKEELHASLPPKPKPKYVQKIKNSGGININEGVMMQRVQSNMEVGVELAGFGYFPPLAVHLLDSIGGQGEGEEEGEGQSEQWSCMKWKMRVSEILMIVIIILMIILL